MPTGILNAQISEAVSIELIRLGLNQSQFAQQLGWSQTFLNRRMLGRVAFSTTEIETIAEALDIPLSRLLDPPFARRRAS